MKYKDYDILDFLSDDFFIQWVKRPDDNTRHFWEKWIKENPDKRKEVMEAISIIRSVKYPRTMEMNDKMYVETFENILNAEKDRGKGDGFSENHHFSFNGIKNMAAFLIILISCLLQRAWPGLGRRVYLKIFKKTMIIYLYSSKQSFENNAEKTTDLYPIF